ncbi:MAG: hypothetical protein K2X77_04205 [Candidatus Obscuribacterales bacterium]|jgi:hypothetical protein|nr:hypothetical protein [Candidatus Obscuribacterales bacterium]
MSQSDSKLKPGDCVFCRVQSPDLGGYKVSLTPSGIEGFLPSREPIELGTIVPATLVCMDGEKALLNYAFIMGTSSRVQHSTNEKENAFAIWAEAYPNSNRPGRAIDLVMPPIQSAPVLLKSKDKSHEFFPSLEASQFTGCLKVTSQKRLSRSAVVLFRGRAVGSVYTTKASPDPYRFEVGLQKMLEDVSVSDSDAELEMYELRDKLVLPMSAMFLGYIDNTVHELSNSEYAEKMLEYFSREGGTSCLSLMQDGKAPCALGFICDGEFQGSYSINDRVFSQDKEFFFSLLEKVPNAKLKTYVLPAAMTTESVLFGYSLNSEQFVSPPKTQLLG